MKSTDLLLVADFLQQNLDPFTDFLCGYGLDPTESTAIIEDMLREIDAEPVVISVDLLPPVRIIRSRMTFTQGGPEWREAKP